MKPGDMKAAVLTRYGGNDTVEVRDVPIPAPRSDEVLIRVRAAGVNPVDWKVRDGQTRILTGSTFPKILGIECAGEIAGMGAHAKKYSTGDQVIANTGMRLGAYAEYVAVAEKTVFPKPHNVSFEDAATVLIAGLTALQALRDKGKIGPGMNVLINGAAGGVGTFAVQIAKTFGARVVAVCSKGNADLVKGLGADRVLDRRQQDFTEAGETYDIIFDAVSTSSFGGCKRSLTRRGVYVNTLPGPSIFWNILITSMVPGKKAATMMVSQRADDVAWLCDQIGTGKVKVVQDTVYPLERVQEALAHSETGTAKGKIILSVA